MATHCGNLGGPAKHTGTTDPIWSHGEKEVGRELSLYGLYAFAAVLVCWVGWAYRMAFGDKMVFFWSKPAVALNEKYLLDQAVIGSFGTASMVYFQFFFAAITMILIAGALLGRMNFRAWILFVPLWLTFSYTIGAYSIWCPDGWLAKLGVIDFAGGFVIHLASGVAGFIAAHWVGPREGKDRENFPPNNILVALAGAGLLWMGWTGFDGGAPYAASNLASLAVLNTHVCTATSLLTWLTLDMFFFRRPSIVGAIQGMKTGLVCITPAAVINLLRTCAMLGSNTMGLLSGSIPWYTMMALHKMIKLLQYVDDTMAIIHTHAVAGSLGGILAGMISVPKLCRLFYAVPDKYISVAYGLQMGRASAGFHQLQIQLIGIVFIIILNIVMTSLICWIISLIVPLRLSEEELVIGDDAVHGEEAYALWGEGRRFDNAKVNSVYDMSEYLDAHSSPFQV
ncbi:Ammonium transporter AmtB-like domain [Dillenia turbinata]|uniref:Ammonium transporter AmtB-like domain n=1 Tax=Dillenia turbinata TaxID=194707 RepID=A0AAN8YSL8_9MAGN